MSDNDFAALIGPVAVRLWGPPNDELSRDGVELRWGTRGSRKVDLAKGTWYDFENNDGGGVLDLIVKETNCADKRAAHSWLVENRFVDEPTKARIVAEYDYTDEQGEVLFQVVRFKPKDFRQRRPDGRDWIWNLKGVRRVPFQLPKVIAAVKAGKVIYFPEGEKDCLTVRKLGLVATTCPGGANKWRKEYNEYFRDADCVILPDNDDPGRSHSEDIAKSLHGVARRVRVVDLAQHWPEGDAPEKADITKWIQAGGSVTKLEEIIAATSDWEPLAVETSDTVASATKAEANKRIDELVLLDSIAYDQVRKVEAKKLGIRPSTLDNAVNARREELAEEAEVGFLEPVEPWSKSVKGDVLLAQLHNVIERHIILGKGCSTAIALWILHAHAHNAARHSPILLITSPTKRCGKTNLLALLTLLVPKPLSAANVTPATVFRAIERWRPTLLIDEGDTFISDKSELRGVLNSGHTRSQAYVLRCVGDDLVPKTFSTWAPKAFATIGRIHPTLEDRAIPIEMKRKLPSEKVKRLPKAADAYDELRRKCTRWAADNIKALTVATPTLPDLHDRARDNWEPLLAIAEACGEDWAELARTVAVKLSAIDDDETYSIQLLQDLKWLFDRERKRLPDHNHGLSSTEIITELNNLEDRPWPEFRNGKPITARGVAKLLRGFKVFPRKVPTIDGVRESGYREEWFTWVFKRYLGEG